MNLFQNILNKVAPEPKSTFLSGFTPTPIFTGKTTSEKIASGEIKATKATPKEMQSAFGKEPAFGAGKGGIGGSILRNISKTPSTFDPNKQIIEPVLTPIETGINKTITGTTEFVGSGQKELASRKTVRQSETDRKIDETINELANEGYTEEQIMSVFEDLNTEGFFKDKPGVVEGMSQRFFGSLESGVNRATEAQASPYSLPEKSLATGIAIPSTIVSAPFNALFGGALEKGMENLPDEAKQKIAEAGQIYEQFAQQNPRTAFNIKTASDVATIAPLSPKVRGIVTKPIGKVVTKVDNSISDLRKSLSKNNAVKAQKLNDEGLKEIYEAVNPTTRENKAVLRQRVEDLLPYIDENKRFANDLETVKGRVDVDKNVAFKAMEDYETNVGVKGKVDTASVAKALENKYMEKIGDSFVNKTEAEIAKELIDTLKGFGKTVNDADIIKIRRAWDKIIEKNKGFMQSADATSKGDIFADANRFFREEIKKSNPEYAKYLEKAHKTITISDILDATIQRRTGQTQGGFLRQGLENAARIAGTGLGGTIGGMVGSPATGAMIGFGASELLMGGVKKLTGSSAKLTKGKKLILKNPKNVTNPINNSNTRVLPMESTEKQLTSGPRLKTPVTPKVVKPSPKPIVKNLQKTGDMETKKLIEEARKYKSAEEFVKAQGKKYYHGTNAEFDTFDTNKIKIDNFGKGFYFFDDKTLGDIYAKRRTLERGGKENVIEASIKMNKTLDIRNVTRKEAESYLKWKFSKGNMAKENINKFTKKMLDDETVGGDYGKILPRVLKDAEEWIRLEGYDSAIIPGGDKITGKQGIAYLVFNPSQINTSSKLKKIWEQANKKTN